MGYPWDARGMLHDVVTTADLLFTMREAKAQHITQRLN